MGATTREAQPLRAVPVALRLVVGHLAFGKALERRLEVHVRSSGSWGPRHHGLYKWCLMDFFVSRIHVGYVGMSHLWAGDG